ncbi:hypothetical protein HPP92_027118 [Vanilla planifolia]|uniref:Homeobox-leucine zipper protein n=1 Tax=Vanilla planifolia TaxID=51239 RepID=A0A835PCN4_VANPL|nr:hypothetical protein HPP92_027118 [Vanilla planifolia]
MASCNGMASSPFFPPNFLLQMQTPNEEEDPDQNPQQQQSSINPLLLPSSLPQEFSRGMVATVGKRSVSFPGNVEACEGEDDLSDDCSQPGEKKRRLNMEQVRTLEKNFELGNKLEPERKMQLARVLGLQQRQIAIWFQNRRARWKTKQLEKDYDSLKRQLEAIKAENDALHSRNKKLQAQIQTLKGRDTAEQINLNKETEGSCSNRSENSSELNLDISRTPTTTGAVSESIPFFPAIRPPPVISQLLHASSRPDLHCAKFEQGVAADESFNLLCSMEDQNAFWPWPDHHSFH